MKIDTTGASSITAKANHLSPGVSASHKMAEHDYCNMQRYQSNIRDVAREKGIDSAVIAAIISRESRAGTGLENGWGDHGNAFGLMQVDRRYHSPQGAWDSREHIAQATGILVGFIGVMKKRFQGWTQEQYLKGGIAAYNCGPGRVESYENIDKNTTSSDYSNDVVARAQFYKSIGF